MTDNSTAWKELGAPGLGAELGRREAALGG